MAQEIANKLIIEESFNSIFERDMFSCSKLWGFFQKIFVNELNHGLTRDLPGDALVLL